MHLFTVIASMSTLSPGVTVCPAKTSKWDFVFNTLHDIDATEDIVIEAFLNNPTIHERMIDLVWDQAVLNIDIDNDKVRNEKDQTMSLGSGVRVKLVQVVDANHHTFFQRYNLNRERFRNIFVQKLSRKSSKATDPVVLLYGQDTFEHQILLQTLALLDDDPQLYSHTNLLKTLISITMKDLAKVSKTENQGILDSLMSNVSQAIGLQVSIPKLWDAWLGVEEADSRKFAHQSKFYQAVDSPFQEIPPADLKTFYPYAKRTIGKVQVSVRRNVNIDSKLTDQYLSGSGIWLGNDVDSLQHKNTRWKHALLVKLHSTFNYPSSQT